MVIAADYPFLEIVGTMLVFCAWVIWFWLLITVFADLFARHDISGWGKAGWTLLCIALPFIGVLLYLGTQGSKMAERRAAQVSAQHTELDSYIRNAAVEGGATGEIAQAKQLLDSGAIDEQEFAHIKQKALA